MKTHRFVAFIIVGTSLCLLGYRPAFAATVDCDGGVADYGSINDALAASESVIDFTGTCTENVFPPSGTQLIGVGPASSVLEGFIAIIGATNVLLEEFRVTGADNGINAVRGSFADIFDMVVDEGQINVVDSSGVRVGDSTITSPANDQAMQILRTSTVVSVGGNTIEATGPNAAIVVGNNSNLNVVNAGNTIIGSPLALRVRIGSAAEFRGATLMGNVEVRSDSETVFGVPPGIPGGAPVTVNGDIAIRGDSAVIFELANDVVTFNGTATCEDDESSVSGLFAGSGVVSCTGFEQFTPPGMGMGP